jgi:hypothetical protein
MVAVAKAVRPLPELPFGLHGVCPKPATSSPQCFRSRAGETSLQGGGHLLGPSVDHQGVFWSRAAVAARGSGDHVG